MCIWSYIYIYTRYVYIYIYIYTLYVYMWKNILVVIVAIPIVNFQIPYCLIHNSYWATHPFFLASR